MDDLDNGVHLCQLIHVVQDTMRKCCSPEELMASVDCTCLVLVGNAGLKTNFEFYPIFVISLTISYTLVKVKK